MSIFTSLGKVLGVSSKDLDVEEYMNAAEMEQVDVLHEPADHYIKPISLRDAADAEIIKRELTEGNIILMNISEMTKRPNTLKGVVDDLKGYTEKINGDIARIDDEKILLTPVKIKIIKSRKPAQQR